MLTPLFPMDIHCFVLVWLWHVKSPTPPPPRTLLHRKCHILASEIAFQCWRGANEIPLKDESGCYGRLRCNRSLHIVLCATCVDVEGDLLTFG